MATANFYTQNDFRLMAGEFSLPLYPVDENGVQIVIDDSETPDEWYFEHYSKEAFADYGVNSYILRRMIQAEKKRINDKILPLFKEYGFNEYIVAARFSNGETWYNKVA